MEHDSGYAGAVVTVVFGWLETKATSRSNQEFARGPDWLGFTDKIMAAHPVETDVPYRRVSGACADP